DTTPTSKTTPPEAGPPSRSGSLQLVGERLYDKTRGPSVTTDQARTRVRSRSQSYQSQRVATPASQDRGVMVRVAAPATDEDAMRPVKYSWKEALNIPREIVCTWVKIGFRHMTSIQVAHSRHEASSIHRFSCSM